MSGSNALMMQMDTVTMPDVTATAQEFSEEGSPVTATAFLNLNSNGTIETSNFVSSIWLKCGTSSLYDVRYTQISGSAPTGGTLNTWLSLSSGSSISMQASQPGQNNRTGTFLVEIRSAESGVVLSSGTLQLTATVIIV